MSIRVRGVSHVSHMSGVTSNRVWVSDGDNLILTDTTGDTIYHVTDTKLWRKGIHTVNSSGELIYIDINDNINKIAIYSKTVTTLLESPTSTWGPESVYCSPLTGDLMVGMYNSDTETGKITRYSSTGQQHILTIQHDNTGNDLYRYPGYITENKNGDIIVSDWDSIVVTERGGRHRFSYTGPPSGSLLAPWGICTDALSHILVCDVNTGTIQIIDKDGHFLSLLMVLTQEHWIYAPCSLNYDDKTNLLWVGSMGINTVSVYRYIQRGYSLTDDSVDDDEKISKSTNEKKISEHTSRKPASMFLTLPGKEKRRNMPVHLGITKEDFAMREKFNTFCKNIEYQREKGEAPIRIKSVVNSLGIEENPRLLRSQIKDCEEMNTHLDYLDCVGLDFGTTTKPFIQSIEPFHSSSVSDFLEWIKNSKIVLRKTRSTQWGSISSVLFAIYAKDAILEFKPKELAIIIDYSMQCAMEIDNYLLAFEIVKTYLFDHVIQLQRIFQDTKEISPVIIRTVLQTSRTMILRKFPNFQNNAIILSFCLDCGQGNHLVMLMLYEGNIAINDRIPKEVMGLKLVLCNLTQPSDEALSVFKSVPVSKKIPLPKVTEGEARTLFRKHSNLTMISASPYKSMGYSNGKHRVVEKPCINLFCFHKGYIPYGEEKFPKYFGDFEVDVQEGYCVLGSGAALEIGGYIRRAECGSIGGFVDLPNNKTGLITCAHVIFSSKELEELESMNGFPQGIEVNAFDKAAHTYKVCGTCTAAEFPKCFQQAKSPHPNVDAVLIELDPSIDTFRLRNVSSDQLYSAGFDPDNPPTFSGEVVPLSDPDPLFRTCGRIPHKLDSVVKYGVETGLTIGDLYHSGAHVRFMNHELKLPDNSRSAIMCDQIEIQNFPQGQFFECGDSGSFVFCINPDKTLSCLGMAVGLSLPQKSCLVTPIDRILRSVCPQGARLKPCSSFTQQSNAPPQATLDMILAAIGNFQTSLQNIEANVRNDFQTSLQNVQTSLHNVERNVERNFQTIQNVQTEVRTLQRQVQQTEDSKTQSTFNQSSANHN